MVQSLADQWKNAMVGKWNIRLEKPMMAGL
jgi:hypothetical protein